MKLKYLLALILIQQLSLMGFAQPVGTDERLLHPQSELQMQQQGQSPQPQPSDAQSRQQQPSTQTNDVVRITTNLVQIDAVVTDKDGKIVSDLTADDFEIYEEGKLQPISNFSFIATDPSAMTASVNGGAAPAPSATEKKQPAPPPAVLRRENLRRTMALIADDVCMTIDSADRTREALHKFVDEQMQPGDLLAVFRTRGGVGALQQFTTDKTQLHAAIKAIRWYPPKPSDLCGGSIQDARTDYTLKVPSQRGVGQGSFESATSRTARQAGEDFQKENSALASINAIKFVLRGLQRLPGRKSAVIISDGIAILAGSTKGMEFSGRALGAVTDIINVANRASVVIYAVDSRTLGNPYMMTAADDVLPDEIESVRQSRGADYAAAQTGSSHIAQSTGGLFLKYTDIGRSLRRMMADQSGYYLIGYRPSEETFQHQAAFRNIRIRVKRQGLTVRSRNGFYAIKDEDARPRPRSNESPLYAALASPLSTGDVRTRLTPMFGQDKRAGYFIRALLYIEPRDLTFTDEPNGSKKLTIDVAAVTFDEKGTVYDEFTRSHTAHFDREQLAFVQQNGLIYSADVPVKEPGAYTFRIAVSDAVSQRIGSAGQFLTIPNLSNKNTFALSAIMLAEASENGTSATVPPAATVEAALALVPGATSPAVRRFQPGMVLTYAHLIYNARSDKAGNVHVTTQVRLFRDGKEIFASSEMPLDMSRQTASERLLNRGSLRLPAQTDSGEYVLQIVVNDDAPGGKRRTTSQWIDFEIVR